MPPKKSGRMPLSKTSKTIRVTLLVEESTWEKFLQEVGQRHQRLIRSWIREFMGIEDIEGNEILEKESSEQKKGNGRKKVS